MWKQYKKNGIIFLVVRYLKEPVGSRFGRHRNEEEGDGRWILMESFIVPDV